MGLNKGYLEAKTDKASDEVYTPAYAVKPIIKYIDRGNKEFYTIWCPFDKEDSEFVKLIRAAGHKVIASHIDDGKNFFIYEPEESYDYIISNPPFSIKDDILKHLYELNKPYAMLLPLPVLQGQKRFPYIKDCEALIFDKRINYYKDSEKKEVQKGVSFASIYLCRNFLPQDLIFEELEIN
jgi:hypothetical protein